jgi:hypothetical protein
MNGKYRKEERACGNRLSGYGITIESNETLRSKDNETNNLVTA